jgi:hypothetical protein
MSEADRGGAAGYNYARFDEYVAAGVDLADEEAFWASPRAGQSPAAGYNYARFDEYVAAGVDLADEEAFWASPRAGQRAPDFTLPRLDGTAVQFSDRWRSRPLVMEFGSFT